MNPRVRISALIGLALLPGCATSLGPEPILMIGFVEMTRYEEKFTTGTGRPTLPWPPQEASAMVVLPHNMGLREGDYLLSDIDRKLQKALSAAGYTEFRYHHIPGGFALVTRIEQIDSQGKPLDTPARWSIEPPRSEHFTLLSYIRTLFTAEVGYFRVIVFAVTSHPFFQIEGQVTSSEAQAWLVSGYNVLPSEVAEQDYTEKHRVTALIYEFEKLSGAREAYFLVPGRFSAIYHLSRSGFSAALVE